MIGFSESSCGGGGTDVGVGGVAKIMRFLGKSRLLIDMDEAELFDVGGQ